MEFKLKAVPKPTPTPKKKRTRIKAISVKREAQVKKYSQIRKNHLDKNPKCGVCKHKPAVEIHHILGRLGDLLCDPKNFLGICRGCHVEVEMNPNWAKENGYSKDRL